MTETPLQSICANISTQAYSSAETDLPLTDDMSLFGGYQKADIYISPEDIATGFYAEAWSDGKGSVIIAFRGTDFSAETKVDFWDGNFPLAFGNPDAPQFKALQHFVEAVQQDSILGDAAITFTGHSLGAGLATLASLYYDSPAYTFAPAPFMNTALDWRFMPEGLDSEFAIVLNAARDAYDNAYQVLLNQDYPPSEADALALAVRDSIPGYQAAEFQRLGEITLRETNCTSVAVEYEVLSRYDPVINALGILSWVPKAGGPALSDFTIDIGGADPGFFGYGEAVARHSMALHALVLQTDFEGFLASHDQVRNVLLSATVSPVSTPTTDSIAAQKDTSILYRAWLLDSAFRDSFETSFGGISASLDTDLSTGLALLSVQKATLFVDNWRLQSNHGTFSPWSNTTGNAISATMGDIDVSGATDTWGHSVVRLAFDQAFAVRLNSDLIQDGANPDEAAAWTKSFLGWVVDEPYNRTPLGWQIVSVYDGSGSMEYDAGGLSSALVFGGAGSDTLRGSAASDYLSGGNGDDLIEGGGGADVILGGGQGVGGDTVSYAGSDVGVNIALGTYAEQSGGHAQGDVLVGFENVIGSAHADHLRGDDNINWLQGIGGNDVFYVEQDGSAATGDTFDGGDGFDTINLSAANDLGVIPGLEAKFIRYTVDLGQGHVQGGEDSDVWTNLVSVENVEGSAYADQIFGDDGQNHLSGGAGNDYITGGGGNDVIVGGGDWNPNDTEVDTVCFSGVWSDYTVTMSYGLDDILSYISVADRIADRDGVDAVYSCEWFQFQGTLLRYDQVANKAPTDVSLVGSVWNLIEDGFGQQPTASVIAALSSSDLNNTYIGGMSIDTAVYTLSPESSAYYEISGNEIIKKSFSIDYEAWYTKIHSIYDAIISPAGVTFSSWLDDIADGVSSIRQADVIAALEWPYKLLVTATDSGGLSYTKSLIVSVGNLSGSFTGDEADNVMTGTSEEDVSYGLGGDDTFLTSYGPDQMFGGAGSDTVSYAVPVINGNLFVDLVSGGTAGDAIGDTYNSVENVIGSNRNDVLRGDSFNNEFTGGQGNDQIVGRGGIDTVIFSGNWSQYAISYQPYGNGLLGPYYVINDLINGRDGSDNVETSVEWFRFADVTLSASELLNQKPVASIALNSNLEEDVAGIVPASRFIGSVSVVDPNNLNSAGTAIDAVSVAIAQVSSPYYTLVGAEMIKLAGVELDYESWYSNLYSAWLSSGGSPTKFGLWINDIKTDGISTSIPTPSTMLSLIDPRYKVTLELTDSHGSYQSTFVVYVKDVEGHVTGDGNDNILVGTNEEDTIQGLGGNDTLEGLLGSDVLDGGTGSDTASYKHADAGVSINLLTNVKAGSHAIGDTFVSIENLEGSDFLDTLTGDDTNNVLSGLAGNDILNGGGGDDVIRPGAGRDSSNGGSGINTIDYTDALVTVTIDLTAGTVIEVNASGQSTTGETAVNFQNAYGSNQSNRGDTLYGTSGNNILKGFAGDDSFYGRGGSDVFDGGVGVDKVSWIQETAGYISVNLGTGHNEGVAADDILISIENIEGTNGNDIIVGDDADNSLYGMGGDDTLDGGAGSNALYGGAGNDTFIGGIGNNWIDGGSGFDIVKAGIGAESVHALDTVTVDYSLSTTSVSLIHESWYNYLIGHGGYADGDFVSSKNIILIGSQYDDHLQGKFSRPGNLSYYPEYGNDVIYGGGGNDLIETSNGNNIAYGEQGNDTIIGKDDVDTFSGGDGDDSLDGGKGADSLFGGAGWDWIDPGSDTDVDLVDFGDDGGGLKFTGVTASGSSVDGWGIDINLTTMEIKANPSGGTNGSNLWSNDIIVGGEVTGVWGTKLNDVIVGTDGENTLISGGGYDLVHAGGGNDYIKIEGGGQFWGEGGQDFIEIRSGAATIYGGDEADTIYGGRDADNLFGDEGNDVIYAYNPDFGGLASENYQDVNHLTGGAGADTMYGGNGTDYFHSLDDGDMIYGYLKDSLSFSDASHGVTYDASAGSTMNGTGVTGIYEIIGSEYSDHFMNIGWNWIYGGGGDDSFNGIGTFYGQAGDDTFIGLGSTAGTVGMSAFGGEGNDTLYSGVNSDLFTMDGGDDIYVARHNGGTDVLYEFDVGAGSQDKIVLDYSYLIKDGSIRTFEEFKQDFVREYSYGSTHYTYLALGDTKIELMGGNFGAALHPDDFLFV